MDRKILPAFIWAARPLEIPSALLELDPESEVLVSNGRGGTGTVRAGEYIKELRETIARQADGFYTTQEASHILAEAVPGMNAIGWQSKFNEAWRSGVLIVRDRTTTKKSLTAAKVDYTDLVKDVDLDAWLKNDGGVYLFPRGKPIAPPAPEVTDQTEAVEAARAGPVKRRNWRDVAMQYIVETYRSGKYRTAHTFYAALVNKAGIGNSPFTVHNRELFLNGIGQSVAEKTIANEMPKIKAAALKPQI